MGRKRLNFDGKMCSICGVRKVKRRNKTEWRNKCYLCEAGVKTSKELKIKLFKYRKPYYKYRKSICDFCKFVPISMCQLDVDHIDGNHSNNNPENLQTLCANCHRLKTFLSKEN